MMFPTFSFRSCTLVCPPWRLFRTWCSWGRSEHGLVPDLSFPQGLFSGATTADQVGRVRPDPGCRGNLPFPAAGGPLVGRRGYAAHAAASRCRLLVVLTAHPIVYRRSRVTLAPVRHRPTHKPH